MIFMSQEDEKNSQLWLDSYYPRIHRPSLDAEQLAHTLQVVACKFNRSTDAVQYFYDYIDPLLSDNVVLTVVPPHDAFSNSKSGVQLVVARLVSAPGKNRTDACKCLVRHMTIQSLSGGGSRAAKTHRDSIRVEHEELIREREVLVLDDVRTTGTSMSVCIELLLAAGAGTVKGLALGQTTYPPSPTAVVD